MKTASLCCVSVAAGVSLGIFDVHQTSLDLYHGILAVLAFLLAAYSPRHFAFSSTLLVACVYAVHRVCIGSLGYAPPYVEQDPAAALYCFHALVPALLAGAAGAMAGTVSVRHAGAVRARVAGRWSRMRRAPLRRP